MNKFEDNSGDAKDMLRKAVIKAAHAVGLFVQAEASKLCVVDTGRLRASITFVTSEGASLNSASRGREAEDAAAAAGIKVAAPGAVVIGTPVEYAVWIEQGTKKRPARPFLKPAAVGNEDVIKKMISDILGEGMNGGGAT